MTAIFYGYALFLLESVTVLVALGLAGLWLSSRSFGGGGDDGDEGRILVRRLDLGLREQVRHLRFAGLAPGERRLAEKAEAAADKQRDKLDKQRASRALEKGRKEPSAGDEASGAPLPSEVQGRVFVLDFVGDLAAQQVTGLRVLIDSVIAAFRPGDEVLLRLESPGGAVHGYGLAGAQLARLRESGIPLTIAVDKIAASGGYMMAVVGNSIVCAPFAMVGSIGVVATLPNFHKLLQRHDVDIELHTAGKFKRTLTVVGENTEEGRQKFREDLDVIHSAFRDWVGRHRPQLDLDRVSTGEVWLGEQAVSLGLCDSVGTSDAWLLARRERPLLHLRWQKKRNVGERFGLAIADGLSGVAGTLADRAWARLARREPF